MTTQKNLSNHQWSKRCQVSVLLLGLLGSSASACTREEARDSAQDIKQGVHEVGNKVKAGAEDLKHEMPEVKQQVKAAANEAGDALKAAGHEVKQTALEARQKVREGIHDTENR
jgi:hypothetical protein